MTDTAGSYTAYSYLTAGEDFRSFELAPEFGRVPPYAAGLTAEQAGREHLPGPAVDLGGAVMIITINGNDLNVDVLG
jgi:hypothetical protein